MAMSFKEQKECQGRRRRKRKAILKGYIILK
jgi:hypothetical protein